MVHSPVLLYIGTFTETLPYVSDVGPGLVVARFNPGTRRFSVENTFSGVPNPTFLAMSSSRKYLYAACETERFDSRDGGGAAAFRLAEATGHPALLNTQHTEGSTPCHLALAGRGRWVVVTNYGSGSLSVLESRPDGALGPPVAVHKHEGSGPISSRQASPHPHMALPDGQDLVYVPDLGTDMVVVYHLDANTGAVTRSGAICLPPGSGPRHMALHPSRAFGFLVNELDSTVACLRLAGRAGDVVASVSTIPEPFHGANAPAAILVDASGTFVYVSNRGHDSISVLRFDSTRMVLEPWQTVGSGGASPRDLALSPSGDLLFAVNQTSDNVVAFAIDSQDGRLFPVAAVNVRAPACALVAGHRRRAGGRSGKTGRASG